MPSPVSPRSERRGAGGADGMRPLRQVRLCLSHAPGPRVYPPGPASRTSPASCLSSTPRTASPAAAVPLSVPPASPCWSRSERAKALVSEGGEPHMERADPFSPAAPSGGPPGLCPGHDAGRAGGPHPRPGHGRVLLRSPGACSSPPCRWSAACCLKGPTAALPIRATPAGTCPPASPGCCWPSACPPPPLTGPRCWGPHSPLWWSSSSMAGWAKTL